MLRWLPLVTTSLLCPLEQLFAANNNFPTCLPQDTQGTVQVATEACGFITIVGGSFLLHATRDIQLNWSDLAYLTK